VRLVLRAAAIVAGLIVCLPLHYLWKLFGRPSPWPQIFLRWTARRCGLRVRIEGAPLPRDVLMAANHVTWLDIVVLGGAAPASFVARDDVARWPAVGWAAGLNQTIYIARHDRGSVRGQADQLRQGLAAGRAVVLFPEGTTEGGHEVLPFRASLFASLFPPLPGVRVQPVAIDYGALAEEVAWVGEESASANARRILSRPGTIPVTLRFLAPLDPGAAGDRKALSAAARAEIVAALASEPRPLPLYGER
jgi:1-acyl-sn-glycerol-3-phosphate acyltransferase